MKTNEEKSSSEGKQSEGKEATEGEGLVASVPYVIVDGDGYNMHVATFTVPVGLEEQIASRYITCRGSQFAFELEQQPGKIRSTFYSSDPQATAEAIGVRLTQRIQDPSPPGAEECCIM